jgi:multidrug resistance efflux pump
MQRRGIVWAQKLTAAQANVAQAQAKLVEAAKRRKAIEKLRERQMQRWQLEQERKQALELDEVSMRLAFENLQLQDRAKAGPKETGLALGAPASAYSGPAAAREVSA